MKKIKILAFFAMITLCLSLVLFKPAAPNNAYATENSNEVEVKVDELTSQNTIFTDSTKKYILLGNSEGKTITFVNDSLVEKTFYITLNNLFLSASEDHPVISIQDVGVKTTVHFNIQGSSELYGTIRGAIHLGKYFKEGIEIAENPKIVVDFSTEDNGTIELLSNEEILGFGTRKSQTIFIDENVDATIGLCKHNTKLTSFTVNDHGLDTFEEGIAEATGNASKSKCKIRLEKSDIVQNRIEFNMMGHGNQVSSVLLPEDQTTYTPNKVADTDGLVFYGWYKDITLNHKWNPKTDTVTEDITLYAGWFIPAENKNADSSSFPVWAIIVISVSAFVILLANAYVLVYFCLYKKGKVGGKFFNAIYKPLKPSSEKQSDPAKEQTTKKESEPKKEKSPKKQKEQDVSTQIKETKAEKTTKKENAKAEDKKSKSDAETKSKGAQKQKSANAEKNQSTKNGSKKESLNKNNKNNNSKNKTKTNSETKQKKDLNKKSK